MSGIRLKDDLARTSTLGQKPSASQEMGPYSMRRWVFLDGNELAVTARRSDGRIVYLESSWGRRIPGSPTDYPGVNFGETTLAELRARLGSNGFSYASRSEFKTADGIATTNSYEIADTPGAVVTFVSLVRQGDIEALRSGSRKLGEIAKVDSVILADADYLNGIWGKDRRTDPAAQPVRWDNGPAAAGPAAALIAGGSIDGLVRALECNSTFKPEAVLGALQKGGVIGKKPVEVVDGIPSFEPRTRIEFHGLTVITVQGWNHRGRMFSRGPGTAPPIHVGITVLGDEKQVTETLRQNGIPLSPSVEGKPFLFVSDELYSSSELNAKYRGRKMSEVICSVH